MKTRRPIGRRRGSEKSIPLIAVIGPVEPALFREFIAHYERLGIERFLLAFHFPHEASAAVQRELLAEARVRVGEPEIISIGPWHENTNLVFCDELRRRAGEGWHLIADADEFQFYPGSVSAAVDEAKAAGDLVVEGLLLDRVAADGELRPWSPHVGLDRSYVLGGFLTYRLLGGDPRKVVLAHASAKVTMGNHISPGREARSGQLVPVHHFKWREGLLDYLRQRLEKFSAGVWHEATPHMRNEAQRLFVHLAAHHGRINVDEASIGFRRVSLTSLPSGWDHDSALVMEQRTARLQPRRATVAETP